MRLSGRIRAVGTSRTVQFTALLQERVARGEPVINLAVGEPDFETPPAVVAATQQALVDGKTRYSHVQGLRALKSGLSKQFEGYGIDNIIVSNGAKQVLYTIFQVICDPLDEVIVPRPCWVSFSEQIKLASAVPVFVDTVADQLDCEAVSAAITERTRAILINSPNNPTGAVYPYETIRKIADLALSNDLIIVSDEAYEAFVYDGGHRADFFGMPDVRDRLVVVRSFSKTYDMTGFRVGYAVAPPDMIRAMTRLQSHLSGNVCTFAQEGALAALFLDPLLIEKKRRLLQKKRDLAHGYAGRLFDCRKPAGAFYLFPNIRRQLKKEQTSEDFAAALLEKTGVAVVPGEAFGVSGHIRISYAVPQAELIKGFERIAATL